VLFGSLACRCCVDRVALAQPPFHHLSLRGEHNALPGDGTRAFTVFSHDVRTFVEDLDDAIRMSPLEVVRRKGCVMILHLVLG